MSVNVNIDGRWITVADHLSSAAASALADDLCELLVLPLMGFTDTYVMIWKDE